MIHLRAITRQTSRQFPNKFPFTVPVIQNLDTLTFEHEITFIVGENGSGKSTILEAIACAVGSITVGAESVTTDKSLAAVRELAKYLKLTWNKRTKRGFFMRSEDFFGFARRLSAMRADMLEEIARVDQEYEGRSDFAKILAASPFARELHAMRQSYGEDLDANSHGESYFQLFNSRFVPNGLYLLDEPETPLSPLRQLSFMKMLQDGIQQGGQFIIATHSPILMAYPNATIYHCVDGQIQQTPYDELEHVRLTRDFLNDPSAFLAHLLDNYSR